MSIRNLIEPLTCLNKKKRRVLTQVMQARLIECIIAASPVLRRFRTLTPEGWKKAGIDAGARAGVELATAFPQDGTDLIAAMRVMTEITPDVLSAIGTHVARDVEELVLQGRRGPTKTMKNLGDVLLGAMDGLGQLASARLYMHGGRLSIDLVETLRKLLPPQYQERNDLVLITSRGSAHDLTSELGRYLYAPTAGPLAPTTVFGVELIKAKAATADLLGIVLCPDDVLLCFGDEIEIGGDLDGDVLEVGMEIALGLAGPAAAALEDTRWQTRK